MYREIRLIEIVLILLGIMVGILLESKRTCGIWLSIEGKRKPKPFLSFEF